MLSKSPPDGSFDILIIGGGITGAALAFLATRTRQAPRVALLEAGTLACGTSSRSSRFLHGGLRYLAQGRVGLVKRLLQGRAELAGLAPHLVRPAPFLLPLGPATPHPGWLLRGALGLYGVLERRAPRVGGHMPARRLDARGALQAEPLLAGVPLHGALTYGEWMVNDAALVGALAQAASAAGAVVRTHVRCEELLRDGDRIVGVMARDGRSGECAPVRARVVVDATGPWTGQWKPSTLPAPPRPRLARGTHLVLPACALPLRQTLVFFAASDGRALFASPRGRHVIVGTTDVSHSGPPEAATPTAAEVSYLLRSLAAALPAAGVGIGMPVSAFAGVRALAAPGSRGSRASTGALDRDYAVSWDHPGLLAVRGGKLTLALDGARSALRALNREGPALGLPLFDIPGVGALDEHLPAPTPAVEASDTNGAPAGASPAPTPAPMPASTPSSLTWRAA